MSIPHQGLRRPVASSLTGDIITDPEEIPETDPETTTESDDGGEITPPPPGPGLGSGGGKADPPATAQSASGYTGLRARSLPGGGFAMENGWVPGDPE